MDTPVPSPRRAGGKHRDTSDGWHDAWAAALREVELQADQVEQLLDAVHHGAVLPEALDVLQRRWEPPRDIGPVPAAFVERAQALLLRHSRLNQDLERTATQVRRHEQAVETLSAKAPSVPAFVDVAL